MSDVDLELDAAVRAARSAMADLNSSVKFGKDLIRTSKTQANLDGISLAQAIWVQQRLKNFSVTISAPIAAAMPLLAPLVGITVTADILKLIDDGDFPFAYAMLRLIQPDAMNQSYHWLTSDKINQLKTPIGQYLGVE